MTEQEIKKMFQMISKIIHEEVPEPKGMEFASLFSSAIYMRGSAIAEKSNQIIAKSNFDLATATESLASAIREVSGIFNEDNDVYREKGRVDAYNNADILDKMRTREERGAKLKAELAKIKANPKAAKKSKKK